jgi:hypothetical protein
MIEIHALVHGNIDPYYGLVVPTNIGKNIIVNMYTQPGTIFKFHPDEVGGTEVMKPSYIFNSGEFMFDVEISADHGQQGFIKKDGGNLPLSLLGRKKKEQKKEFKARSDNFVLFEGQSEEYTMNHDLFGRTFKLSRLIFELMIIYPGEEIKLNFLSCLRAKFGMGSCPSIGALFNLNKEDGSSTSVRKYIPTETAIKLIPKFIEVDVDPDIQGDEILSDITGMDNNPVIQYLSASRSSSPKFFNFLLGSEQNVQNSPYNTNSLLTSLIFIDTSSNKYKIVMSNDLTDPMLNTIVNPMVNHIEVMVRNFITSILPESTPDDNLVDVNIIVIVALEFTDERWNVVSVPIKDVPSLYKKRVYSRRGINSIRSKLKDTREIIGSNGYNILQRLISLRKEHNNDNDIGMLIKKLQDVCSYDVVVIPYQFICYLFFQNEGTGELRTFDFTIEFTNIPQVVRSILNNL